MRRLLTVALLALASAATPGDEPVRRPAGGDRASQAAPRRGASRSVAPVAFSSSPRMGALPPTILWAWERPTDLSFLDDPEVGVAYLAVTVTLNGEQVRFRPRLQPLVVPPATPLLAVVRIETGSPSPPGTATNAVASQPSVSAPCPGCIASRVIGLARRPGVIGLQMDFDAARSERGFYVELLTELRERLPQGWLLSMTALASWCLGDPWIRGLPVDEAVPMLFQMGPDSREVRARLQAGQDFSLAACRESVGVATGEGDPAPWLSRRRYVFSEHGWTPALVSSLLSRR